jgi:ATP-dependent helicase/DNAse subunit B
MSLSLIVGPPNSGRAGRIRDGFTAALGRAPVLVVPTRDDAERFERELCERQGAIAGGAVCTFPWLFEDVARAAGAEQRPLLTRAQRLAVVQAAVRESEPEVLRASAHAPGFAAALEHLIGELQASGVDPDTLTERARSLEHAAYETELARLYRAYCERRDGLGRGDRHSLAASATAALRADPDSWDRRPVFLYGFDDLTLEELELLRTLADAAEVVAAVTYEDRPALAARAGLLGHLHDELGADVEAELAPQTAYTDSSTLFHLERHLFEPLAPRVEPDGGLLLLEATGERTEAEQVGGEVVRLLAAGTPPDEIAIVLRSPERLAPLYDQVLSELGIPVAVDARIPVSRTAAGRGLLALLRGAFTTRRADDLLAFLRAPGIAHSDQVDWLERDIRRKRLHGLDEALAAWDERAGWRPRELDELRAAPAEALPTLVGALARRLAERPHRRAAACPDRLAELELRAGSEIATAMSEVGELRGVLRGAEDVIHSIERLTLPLWRGSTEGRVRVLSPYRVRARRVSHLFVCSLQEGEFPTHEAGERLLPDERRAGLELPPRREPEDEERYLFYSCVSRPTQRLYLSWRSSDENGFAASRSPLIDDVLDLLDVSEERRASLVRARPLDAVVFAPEEAPNTRELARSLAALGPEVDHADALRALGVSERSSSRILERLEVARERAGALPGPLTVPELVSALRGRDLFGASTLEEYALCSYRWFVGHELRPQNLQPAPEPLTQGAILHEVLERLYREAPGDEAMPRPGDLSAWRSRGRELVAEVADERGLTLADVFGRVARHRIAALLDGFLGDEAVSEGVLRPDPELLEASFGAGEDDARGPLSLDGFGLHGKIDRVDLAPGTPVRGLVQDYKLSADVPTALNLQREGKLQLPLYMLALRDLWGIEPLGGVYRPLGGRDRSARRPRGPLRKEEREGPLKGLTLVPTDLLDNDEFDDSISRAQEKAIELVGLMHQGFVDRNPLRDTCPRWCRFQPICRRERAAMPEAANGDNGRS